MAYTMPAWADSPATTSPLNATNLTQLNTAINGLDTRLTQVALNVKDYGATGNGTTNDTAAFTAAIAATTSDVFVPSGTYSCDLVDVLAGRRLRFAPGAIVVRRGSQTGFYLEDDAVIQGGTLQGGTGDYGIQILGHRTKVLSMKISVPSYGIGASSSTSDNLVEDCRFESVGYYGILVENASVRFVARNNVFYNTNATLGQGITIKTNTGGSPTDTLIEGNLVDVQGTIGLEVQVVGSSRAVITNNVVRNSQLGISLSGAKGVTVTGNTVSNNAGYGIEAAEGTTDSTISGNTIIGPSVGIVLSKGSSAVNPRNCIIANNIIKDATQYGIQTEYANDVVITGNLIQDCADRSLFVNNGGLRHSIIGNEIVHTASSNVDSLFLTGSDHLIANNHIVYAAGGTGYGINANGTTRLSVVGNSVDGGAAAYVFTNGTLHHVVGNSSRNTTGWSIFTSGVTDIYVSDHTFAITSGVGVDLTGATGPHFGTYWLPSTGQVQSGFESHGATKLGFYGTTGIVKQTGTPAAATTTATTQTLVNDIRTKLLALGLIG